MLYTWLIKVQISKFCYWRRKSFKYLKQRLAKKQAMHWSKVVTEFELYDMFIMIRDIRIMLLNKQMQGSAGKSN